VNIVVPLDTSRTISRNLKRIKTIKECAQKEWELEQHPGGYWTYHPNYYSEIQNWLKDFWGFELTYYDGCFHPFLTERSK
jgi:hypothetical protein